MKADKAIERFEGFDLDELRKQLESFYAGHIDSAVEWVNGLRNELLELLREIDDDDTEMTLAVAYAEFKSRWIAYNTKMNYKLLRKGHTDPEDVFRGNAIYWLNTILMELLEESDIDQIDQFLAEPLSSAA